MFIYPAITHYKELWRVEERARSGCLKSVRAEAAIKTVRERIRRNPFWKQNSMSWKLNILTQSSCAPSRTIYTWQRISPQRDTSSLPLWRKSDGQEQSISSSGTPRMGMKTSSSRTRKFSPLRSSITTSTTRFMFKRPLRCVLRMQEAINLPTPWFGGGCPIRGWHLIIFVRKVWKLVPKCIKRMCYKELWNLLTRLSSVVRNGSPSNTKLPPTRPRRLKSGSGGMFRPPLALRIRPWGVRPQPPGL